MRAVLNTQRSWIEKSLTVLIIISITALFVYWKHNHVARHVSLLHKHSITSQMLSPYQEALHAANSTSDLIPNYNALSVLSVPVRTCSVDDFRRKGWLTRGWGCHWSGSDTAAFFDHFPGQLSKNSKSGRAGVLLGTRALVSNRHLGGAGGGQTHEGRGLWLKSG